MKTTKFTWRTATITVREKIGQDAIDENTIRVRVLASLYPQRQVRDTPDIEWRRVMAFTNILLQTVSIEGEFPFALPSPESPTDSIVQAYQDVMNAPASLIDDYDTAMRSLELSETDFLAPTNAKTDEKPPKSESDAA